MVTAGLSIAAVGAGATLADEGPSAVLTAAPTSTTTTTTVATTSTTVRAVEAPEAFFARLAAAFVADDADTLVALLHPAVLARYGEEQCAGHLATLAAAPLELELVAVLGEGPVPYDGDGQAATIPDGIRLRINVVRAGTPTEQDATLARTEDGALHWFTDCGTPVPS